MSLESFTEKIANSVSHWLTVMKLYFSQQIESEMEFFLHLSIGGVVILITTILILFFQSKKRRWSSKTFEPPQISTKIKGEQILENDDMPNSHADPFDQDFGNNIISPSKSVHPLVKQAQEQAKEQQRQRQERAVAQVLARQRQKKA